LEWKIRLSGDIFDFLPREWRNPSDLSDDSSEVSFDSSEVSFDSSEVSFDSSEEFFLSSRGNRNFLGSYLGNSSGEIQIIGEVGVMFASEVALPS
jgi:hypothetical protein